MIFIFIRNHIAKECIQRNWIISLRWVKWRETKMPPRGNSQNIFLCTRK